MQRVKKSNVLLFFFALMNFVQAMSASVFGGILDQVATSLDISIANSGLLTTMYAYGAAIGVPVTLILFRRIDRSKMIKITLLVTVFATITMVVTRNFAQLLLIRLLTGISSGSYNVLAIATVVALSAKERQGRSLAILIMGNSLSLLIGIPLTRALSSVLDWRSIFMVLACIMGLALLYFMFFLPESGHESKKLNLRDELKFFADGRTLLVITFSFIMFMGYFALYNFITPYLLLLFPSLQGMMTLILVLFGVASFVGNMLGGIAADRIGYAKAMLFGAMLQVVWVIGILLFRSSMWLSVALLIIWIMNAWFIGLQVNTGIVQATQNKSSFVISINNSAIQLGGAIGSSFAAVVISASGIQYIAFITLIACLIIVAIQFVSSRKFA